MKTGAKVAIGVVIVGTGLGLAHALTRARAPTIREAWASILPYHLISYWFNQGTGLWVLVNLDAPPVEGREYSIQVSQACILEYDGYYFVLQEGWNTVIWGETGVGISVGLEWHSDPTFYTGSVHTARLTLHNPTQWGWEYTISLQMGGVSQGGWMNLPIGAGQTVTKDRVVTMPNVPGVYPVVVNVWEITTDAFWEFPFEDVVLIEEPVPDLEVVLNW